MKKKILYVEDEIFLAKIVSETLESRGYEVVVEHERRALLHRQPAEPSIERIARDDVEGRVTRPGPVDWQGPSCDRYRRWHGLRVPLLPAP